MSYRNTLPIEVDITRDEIFHTQTFVMSAFILYQYLLQLKVSANLNFNINFPKRVST